MKLELKNTEMDKLCAIISFSNDFLKHIRSTYTVKVDIKCFFFRGGRRTQRGAAAGRPSSPAASLTG